MRNDRSLSIFVDESGNFGDTHDSARYCIVTLVLHDQRSKITQAVRDLDRANEDLGLDPATFRFHTMPLIRQDDEYAAMSRRMRGRILDRMLTFVRNVDFLYCSFCVDADYANTPDQVLEKLERQMSGFIALRKSSFEALDNVKVYYDAGQKQVSHLLEKTIGSMLARPVTFVQGVRQSSYKLLQVADLICAVELISRRLEDGVTLPLAEQRFFGGPRDFKRNLLKKIRQKAMP